MAVTIVNLLASKLVLPLPVGREFRPQERKFFPYIEYDALLNEPAFVRLRDEGKIRIIGGDPSSALFDSIWNGVNKFKLGNFHLWVDATNALRMKNGDALFDFDGFVVGPGGAGLHGATHVFNGSDPIPNIETLEDQWTCLPGALVVGDLAYATGANTCDRANASGIATMPVIGVVQQVVDPTTVIIARAGDVGGFVGLTPDAPYFAGLIAGQMSLTAPVGSGQVVQKIGYAKNTTTIVIALGDHTIRA